jgi:phosphate/sulfate permease
MTIYHWILLAAIFFCIAACFMWFIKLMQRRVKDYAEAKGSDIDGVEYSCTKAMLPNHKESAYKHLPTYTAGIIFHRGLNVLITYFKKNNIMEKTEEKTESQSKQIIRYLQQGNSLTSLDALRLFGCMRLGARIYDLRAQGYPIEGKIITTASGKRVAQYCLEIEL